MTCNSVVSYVRTELVNPRVNPHTSGTGYAQVQKAPRDSTKLVVPNENCFYDSKVLILRS